MTAIFRMMNKYGKIGLDMKALRCIGNLKEIENQYHWM